jgi:acetate---CoA ligase (ADP-forming)
MSYIKRVVKMSKIRRVGKIIDRHINEGRQALSEYESKLLLREIGINVPDGGLCHNQVETIAFARKIGMPVVVKISSENLLHKSDTGGIETGIDSEKKLIAALKRIRKNTGLADAPFLIEKQEFPSLELITGVVRDHVFGPIALIGIGGIFTEILSDKILLIPPISYADFVEKIKTLKGAKLIFGTRGKKGIDVKGLYKTIEKMISACSSDGRIREIEINPLFANADGVCAVDALVTLQKGKEKKAVLRDYSADISRFFEARSIAVIGASSSPHKGGNIIVKNLLTFDYKGKIYPINPRGADVCGLKSFTSIDKLSEVPELTVFIIPNVAVEEELEKCIDKGVKNIIITSGGFSDQGADGALLEAKIIEKARKAGVRVLGPNSIGTITPSLGLVTSITTLHKLEPGDIAFFGQTGVFASGTADIVATRENFRLSAVACIGNKADVNEIHLLKYFTGDKKTRVIAAYLEGTVDGAAFIEAASAAAAAKPFIVLKGGRTIEGSRATASHTGTMAGDFAVYNAVLEKCGAAVVEDFPDLLEIAKVFSFCPLPEGNRLGVVSITGVGCVMSADAAAEYGVVLPPLAPETETRIRTIAPPWAPLRNPVDMWSAIEKAGGAEAYKVISEAIIEQNDIDAILLVFVLIPESDFNPIEIIAPIRKAHPKKPMFGACLGGDPKVIDKFTKALEINSIPVFVSPRRAIRAFKMLSDRALFLKERQKKTH